MATKLKARPPEDVKPGKLKGLLYGTYGSGKSWAALAFPAPYYYDTEGGADLAHYQSRLKAAGGDYLGPKDGTLDPQFLIDQMKALSTEKHGYKTLIIDSITKLYQTAIANEAEKLGDKDAFGASKKPAIGFMRRLMAEMTRLDMNVWFIAHETTEWGKNPTTGAREEIGKIPDCWDKLPYELHLSLHMRKRGKDNRVAFVAKSRLQGFPEGDLIPIQVNGADVSYAEMAQRYGKDAIEGTVESFVGATDEQIAEITHLTSILSIPQADLDKLLSKAQADTWADLSTEQADKTIDWLKKKLIKA